MTVQPADQTPPSLWLEQATRWLKSPETEMPIGAVDSAEEDHDPDPPPAAPAMRPWPRIFPDL